MWKTLMSELAPQDQSGAYTRPPAAYTSVVGVTPSFPASSSYTLYIGNACPWCHRVAIAAALRGVPAESLRIVKLVDDAERASRGGWIVESGRDPLFGAKDLREIYDSAAGGQYFGRCTAPLLVSDAQKVVVANDSAEIVRSIDALPGDDVTLRPAALAAEVDKWVERITSEVNNGVYRAGFATSQTAHDAAALPLYRLLDELDQHLETRRFLCGGSVTEADVVLLPTICRFDDVYSVLFKCSGRRIADLPNLSGWLADMMRLSVIADTYDAASARSSYFGQLFPLNPSGIIPAGGRSTKELVAQWLSRSDPAKRERLAVGVSALHTRDRALDYEL